MNLPGDLINRCRDVLLECDEFVSYENLRNVFVTKELEAYLIYVSKAPNPKLLVDLFLADFLTAPSIQGQPVFPIFLATLRMKYPDGDGRREALTKLLSDIHDIQELSPSTQLLSPMTPLQKGKLDEKLLTLDFTPQMRLFRNTIDQNRIAAFLVHGPPGHGQRSLTRRLIHFKNDWDIAQRIIIDAAGDGVGKEFRFLWRQLAKHMGLSPATDSTLLAEKVCQWWLTQDVIFVFTTVDYMSPGLLASWLENFWKPIVTTARQRQNQTNRYLLLFLVDFDGHVCESPVTLLDQAVDIPNSSAPLKLPPTGKFPAEVLDEWIGSALELLPDKVNADELLAATENGVPNLVYEQIYDYCGLIWEGEKIAQ